MKTKLSPRLRELIVAILTALITYLCSSCAGGIVMGNRTSLSQEVSSSADSARLNLPSITLY